MQNINIEIQETPNPEAVQFLCSLPISSSPRTFLSTEDCANSKLARKLLLIGGVEIVFFGSNFVTITRAEGQDWSILKPQVVLTIVEHFAQNGRAMDEEEQNQKQELSAIEEEIMQILEQYIRPAIAMDGGDFIYRGFKEGIVKISLVGACQGCPSSAMTLKNGIQNTLQYYVPEVVSVELEEE